MGVVAYSRARDVLLAADRDELGLGDVCEQVVRAFRTVASFDGCALMTVDAETLLPTGGVVDGFDPTACVPFWDNELVDADFNKFNVLARSTDPVATLFEAVDGDLDRSPRYRKLYRDLGAHDELRVAFMAGSSCVALGAFVRISAEGPFTEGELVDVRELLPVTTSVLRRAQGRGAAAGGEAPVVLMLDDQHQISAKSAGTDGVLADLCTRGVSEPGVPTVVRVAVARALGPRQRSPFVTRVRGESGRWYRLHVSAMSDAGGEHLTSPVVTIEPARPHDLVPILLESYGLTERETEVTMYLARGLAVKEISAELMISAHTVRDHVKAIYDKSGVNSRGELVAHLFAEHIVHHFHDAVQHVP